MHRVSIGPPELKIHRCVKQCAAPKKNPLPGGWCEGGVLRRLHALAERRRGSVRYTTTRRGLAALAPPKGIRRHFLSRLTPRIPVVLGTPHEIHHKRFSMVDAANSFLTVPF